MKRTSTSNRELERVEVMGRVDSGALNLKDAAVVLELSYRQAKRLWRRYRQLGGKGLQHGNAGRPSNRSKSRSKSLKLRRRVLNLIKRKYSGSEEERFGPTQASEHLAEEDGIRIDHETLRRWMLSAGAWSRQRRRKKHCQRRGRKWHFGELVQPNEYLEKEYLPDHNRRFSRAAAKPEDYHRRRLTSRELREVFRIETMRRISNDWVIRHNRRFLQLQPGQRRYGPTKSKALVCESEDGTMEVRYRGERIGFKELRELPKKISPPVAPVGRAILVKKEVKKDHPWRQGYKHITPWVPNRAIAAPLVGMRTYASP